MFPAKEGDSFLINLNNQKHILIDCGYPDTYNKYIKEEMASIKELELLVVTHYDQDHIYGALTFLKENNEKQNIKIKQVWHNAFKHIQFIKPENGNISRNDQKILKQISLNGYPSQNKNTISAAQGSSLAGLILYGGYNWNIDFNGKSISTNNVQLQSEKYKIYLLSPDNTKLEKLATQWKKELTRKGFRGKIFNDAFEFLTIQERSEVLNRKTKTISQSHNLFEKLLRQSFLEDQSKVTKDNAPENLNTIRKMALQVLSKENSYKASMKRKRKKAARDDKYLMTAIAKI